MKTPHLTIRLSEEDRERLRQLAHEQGDVPWAAVVRRLIREATKEKTHA
jgi:predicted DNA-binding protein